MRSALDGMAQTGIAISFVDLLVGLSLSTVLGLLAVLVYRRTHRGLHYERSFLVTLTVLPPVIAVVMMLIGSNLALSLGLVGALSIIRFRTVIKDSRDMIYLFFGIAIGLGCGTYNWAVITVASLFLSMVLIGLFALQFGKPTRADYALVLSGSDSRPGPELSDTIRKYVEIAVIRSVRVTDDLWEMVFEVRSPKEPTALETELIDALKANSGVQQISLLAPQLSLPV